MTKYFNYYRWPIRVKPTLERYYLEVRFVIMEKNLEEDLTYKQLVQKVSKKLFLGDQLNSRLEALLPKRKIIILPVSQSRYYYSQKISLIRNFRSTSLIEVCSIFRFPSKKKKERKRRIKNRIILKELKNYQFSEFSSLESLSSFNFLGVKNDKLSLNPSSSFIRGKLEEINKNGQRTENGRDNLFKHSLSSCSMSVGDSLLDDLPLNSVDQNFRRKNQMKNCQKNDQENFNNLNRKIPHMMENTSKRKRRSRMRPERERITFN